LIKIISIDSQVDLNLWVLKYTRYTDTIEIILQRSYILEYLIRGYERTINEAAEHFDKQMENEESKEKFFYEFLEFMHPEK